MEDRQYTVVIERPKDEGYFFRNFDTTEKCIECISKLTEPLKVHKIFEMTYKGFVTEMTVGFINGRLGLIDK